MAQRVVAPTRSVDAMTVVTGLVWLLYVCTIAGNVSTYHKIVVY
ncbi:MAG: hypothetical protein ACK45X_02550 [Roseiflexaceae bacterium]